MRIKTQDLQEASLDWAVAKCEGVGVEYVDDGITQCLLKKPTGRFAPSTDWAQGGPIIERERIVLITPRYDGWWTARITFQEPDFDGIASIEIDAPTPLIAAMRCYVASKMGDEVEVPHGL